MTSKEALRLLETRCRFYAQDNDELQETYEAREMIEKDLEVLEILKKHHNKDSLIKTLINIYNDDKGFNKIKDWLENE